MRRDEKSEFVDIGRPSTWVPFRQSLCQGCFAGCCTLPVEVNVKDLLRLGVVSQDEVEGSLKRVAARLAREGVIQSFRARTGLFILAEVRGACLFLGKDRRCTVYDRRPDTCRNFPTVASPRVGYCPAQKNVP